VGIGLIQAFHYETDDKAAFLTVIDTICKVVFPVLKSEYITLFISTLERGFSNGRKWIGPKELSASDPKGWSKPKRFFICTIKDYKTDLKVESGHAIIINNHDEIIKHVDGLLDDNPNFKQTLDERFIEKCGHGYTDWFMSSDGDVDNGYCVSHRPSGGWNNFDISLTHMYYGK